MRSAADGEFDVLLIVDAEHLFCSQAEIEGLISTLLRSGVHTFLCQKRPLAGTKRPTLDGAAELRFDQHG